MSSCRGPINNPRSPFLDSAQMTEAICRYHDNSDRGFAVRIRIPLVAAAAIAAIGVSLAFAQMGGGMMGGYGRGHGMMGNPRHVYYMHHGLPADYAGKTNPLRETPGVLAEGRKLYAANCASCHGADGRGGGELAAQLNPPPADLRWTLSMPVARDDFLYWTISEGGQQFGSSMPAFKSALKPDEIWAVVTALRSGDLRSK